MQFERWTGETAQGYGACMLKPTLLIPLMFLLGSGIGCKDDESTGAQFGEACKDDPPPCADELQCDTGYCAQSCEDDGDCQPIEGFLHECRSGGVCWILCDEKTLACPQSLGVPMKCGLGVCESAL